MAKKLETRNGCISPKGIHFEIKFEEEWKTVTVRSDEVIVHNGELPEELKKQIFDRINALFTDRCLP